MKEEEEGAGVPLSSLRAQCQWPKALPVDSTSKRFYYFSLASQAGAKLSAPGSLEDTNIQTIVNAKKERDPRQPN